MGMTRGKPVAYRCSNDCEQTGCPGHTVRADFHRTSDVLNFVFDAGTASERHLSFDENVWNAMTEADELVSE